MAERPTIRAERLDLRPFVMEDAPEVARMCGEREIAATTLLIPHPYALSDAGSWITGHQGAFEAGKGLNWAMELREGRRLVGSIGLVLSPAHDRAEMGYWVGKEYWGRGYASEAAAAVVRFGFEVLGLHRVEAHHFAGNVASGRVLEKAGMVREGVLKGAVKKWGEYLDVVLWGVVGG